MLKTCSCYLAVDFILKQTRTVLKSILGWFFFPVVLGVRATKSKTRLLVNRASPSGVPLTCTPVKANRLETLYLFFLVYSGLAKHCTDT